MKNQLNEVFIDAFWLEIHERAAALAAETREKFNQHGLVLKDYSDRRYNNHAE